MREFDLCCASVLYIGVANDKNKTDLNAGRQAVVSNLNRSIQASSRAQLSAHIHIYKQAILIDLKEHY